MLKFFTSSGNDLVDLNRPRIFLKVQDGRHTFSVQQGPHGDCHPLTTIYPSELSDPSQRFGLELIGRELLFVSNANDTGKLVLFGLRLCERSPCQLIQFLSSDAHLVNTIRPLACWTIASSRDAEPILENMQNLLTELNQRPDDSRTALQEFRKLLIN